MDSLLDQFEKVSFNLEVPVDSMFLGVLNGASHLRRIEFIGQLLPRFVLRYLRTEPVINWVSQKWKLQELEVANLTSWPDEYKAALMVAPLKRVPFLAVFSNPVWILSVFHLPSRAYSSRPRTGHSQAAA